MANLMDEMVRKEAARGLAVSYDAFNDARNKPVHLLDPRSVDTWGRLLKTNQELTGIEFYDPREIDNIIEAAAKVYDEYHGGN